MGMYRLKCSRLCKTIIGILSLLIVISGAIWWLNSNGKSFVDITKGQRMLFLEVPDGDYKDVVWMKDNRLAFLYAPIPPILHNNGLPILHPTEYQAVLYTIDSGNWLVLPVPDVPNCVSAWVALLAQLPDGRLSFIYECHTYSAQVTGQRSTLYVWDNHFMQVDLLREYPEQFWPGFYTFSPDMSIMIQEQQNGGITDKIYRLSQDNRFERILGEYQRVRSPAWSPDGRTIAFAGTETIPRARSSPFTALIGIGDAVFYPWDLYLMDSDEKNVRSILSGIIDLSIVKWSPQGNRLAFRGEYQGKDGIWVFDTRTQQLTRVWSSLDYYDWSPDGQQMVVLQQTQENGLRRSHPVIIEVPSAAS